MASRFISSIISGMQAASCAVAVIGAGNMAREHVRAFRTVPQVTVAGIQSRTRSRALALAAEFGIPHVCDSLAELHAKTGAVLAVVTVSETAMKTVALASLDHPWTLLLEKPPGLTVEEAEEIEAAAASRGRDVRVGLNRQWLSSTQAVLSDLAACAGPRFVKVQDQQSLALAERIGHPPEVVRHWMYANSIHLVDYFRFLARGEVVSVNVFAPWEEAAPGVVVAHIRFSSGDTGLYEALWQGPGPWAATVTVAGKRWELRPLEQATSQVLSEKPVVAEVHPWDTEFKPGFRLQAQQAVAAACGEPSELPRLADALGTMRLIRAIYGR